MKKLILSTLSVVVIAAAMSSCGKSTKGKLSNDWKIESYTENSTSVQSNGNKTVVAEVYNGSTITTTTTSTVNNNSVTTTDTKTMSDPTYKIEKDGTWTMNKTIVDTETEPGMTSTTTIVRTQSGTWNFVGKNKEEEFKKNERVLFNVLSSSRNETNVTTIGSQSITTTDNSSDTFKAGQWVTVYTVTESKKKELELTSEGASTSTSGANTSSYTESTSMKLVQE